MDIPFKKTEIYFSILALALINFIPNYIQIPFNIQLFITSVNCVLLGCVLSVRFRERVGLEQKNTENEVEKIQSKDAYMFPVYGSCTLFGLYMVIKTFNKDLLDYLILSYVCILGTIFTLGVVSLSQLLQTLLPKVIQQRKNHLVLDKKISFTIIKKIEFDAKITQLDLISIILASIPTYFYVLTMNWNLNNLFGITFCIQGIDGLALPNFKVGGILLWGLFLYDIFWVFGTDVMYTVAKNINAPIKILFPLDLYAEPPNFSLLGLGDIVIPALFISLCLKYDVDQMIKNKAKTVFTPYFNVCLFGYALGIVATYLSMVLMEKGQPALLFLVPGCCGSIMVKAVLNKEFMQLWNYEETELEEQPEKKDQ